MKTLWIVPILIGCLHAAPVPKDVPDFSAGFQQLAALGMPALDAQARWVRAAPAQEFDYQLQSYLKPLKGNGWLLPQPGSDGKPLVLLLGGSEARPSAGTKPSAAQDLPADLEQMSSALRKAAAKLVAETDPFSMRSNDTSAGRLLLFATQLYQTGRPTEANRLAMDVFSVFPTREAAVDAAIDQLAEPIYQKIAAAFFSSGDWTAFHRDLAALAKRFPRGWQAARAAAMMLPQLEKQAAGTSTPPPSLPDTPLDPRALKAIEAWMVRPPAKDGAKPPSHGSRMMRVSGVLVEYSDGPGFEVQDLWLIQKPEDAADKNTSPAASVTHLGMAAIPVLAALTADPFFTYLPNPQSYRSYYSSDESEEERVLRAYQSLSRPATRGELACKLLAATLPDPEDELDNADPETLREIALSFWKDHRDASREDLATVFMKEGSSSQASEAAAALASSTDPKAHQIFEAHILAADPAIGHFEAVKTYLRTRRAAAKPFFEQYAKLVRSQTPATEDDSSGYDENTWRVKQAGGRDKILKQLENLVGAQSPRALAVQIAKGKPEDAEAAIKSLTAMLEEASPTKHLYALLEGANAATNSEIRAHFLTAVFEISWRDDDDDADDDDEPADTTSTPPDRPIPDAEAKVWRKLIADTSPLPKKASRGYFGGKSSNIASLAAAALENSVAPQNFYQVYQAAGIIGKPAGEILLERASARLAGKPMPPLPDATKVSRERLTAIVSEASNQPADAIQRFLSNLTSDERAAWFAWINEPDDLPPPASVIAARAIISARAESPQGQDVKGAAGIDVGFTLSAASLDQLAQSIAADPAKHSRTMVMVFPAGFPPGLQVAAMVFPPVASNPADAPEEDESGDSLPPAHQVFSELADALGTHAPATAVIKASLRTQGQEAETMWWIENGKALPAAKTQEEAENADFSAQLKTTLESPEARFHLQLQILTRADAESFSNEND